MYFTGETPNTPTRRSPVEGDRRHHPTPSNLRSVCPLSCVRGYSYQIGLSPTYSNRQWAQREYLMRTRGGLLEPGSMFIDLWSGYSFMTYPGHLETNTGNYRENVASPPWAGLPSDCFIFLLPHNSSWRISCAWSGLAGARALRVES